LLLNDQKSKGNKLGYLLEQKGGIVIKFKPDESGYPLHEWIRHDVEGDLEVKMESLAAQLTVANNEMVRIKNELEHLVKVKDAIDVSIKYFMQRQ
jgi:hypothetical protein